MTLDEWLRQTGTTETAFAGAIGRTQQSVNRYRKGEQSPDLKTMALIVQHTQGAVQLSDFMPGAVPTEPPATDTPSAKDAA